MDTAGYIEKMTYHLNTDPYELQAKSEVYTAQGYTVYKKSTKEGFPWGQLGTTVYRKPTNTGRCLNFHSCYSSATEQGFIKGLVQTVERLCSTPDLLKIEMERIYSQLMNNSYPKKLIDRVNTRITNQAPLERNWTSIAFLTFQLFQKRSEERSIRKVSEWHSPKPALRKSLTQVKDSIPKDKAGQQVYKLSCQNCTAVYKGETSRLAAARMKEHLRLTKRRP